MSTAPSKMEVTLPITIKELPSIITFPYNFKTRKFEVPDLLPEMANQTPSTQDITYYLSEIQGELISWHKASGKGVILLVSALVILLTTLTVLFFVQTLENGYRITVGLFIVSVMLLFFLFARHIILSVYKTTRAQIIQEMIEKFNNDFNRTACSDAETDYMWVFPSNFPAAIQLSKEPLEGEEDEKQNPEEEYDEIIEEFSLNII